MFCRLRNGIPTLGTSTFGTLTEFGGMMGTVFRLPTGELAMIAITRRTEREPPEADIVAKLDTLRPHICRSFVLSARLRLERAGNATKILESIGIPSCVLDHDGKILSANGQMLALKRHIQWRARDRLSLANREADRLFRNALAGQGMVSSFPVMGPDPITDEVMIAHVIPIRLLARDIFTRSVTMLILTPLVPPNATAMETMSSNSVKPRSEFCVCLVFMMFLIPCLSGKPKSAR